MTVDAHKLKTFLEQLKSYPRVVIQAHDFPDHDAISSAFALSYLLQSQGIESIMVYHGLIDRISIHRMIELLHINIHKACDVDLLPEDKLILVDGCVGEKNVTDLIGEEIAVIDHHEVTVAQGLSYVDVRPHYGATATILFEYFQFLLNSINRL